MVLLANALFRRNSHSLNRKALFSPEALEAIVKYSWPGNIRELENKVHRAVIIASGPSTASTPRSSDEPRQLGPGGYRRAIAALSRQAAEVSPRA